MGKSIVAEFDGTTLYKHDDGKMYTVSYHGNGGSFPVNVWFQLFQAVPDFSRHAGVITRIARDAGIDAKYSGQDGKINVYETLGDSEGMVKSGQTDEKKI